MASLLSKEFDLSAYTRSYLAERHGYKEQYIPSDEIVDNLEFLHNEITVPLLENPNLPGLLYSTSGYRCDRVNIAAKGSKTSDHTKGFANDYEYYEKNSKGKWIECNKKLITEFLKMEIEFDQCIKEFGSDEAPAWIHISKRKSSNRKQVLRIK